MAPEVVLKTPYNEKCDVFSFGILLHEILALKPAFQYAKKGHEFVTKVVKGGRRPHIRRNWPPLTKQVLQKSWSVSQKDTAFNGDDLHPDPTGLGGLEGCGYCQCQVTPFHEYLST
jgi:hypothetical protein